MSFEVLLETGIVVYFSMLVGSAFQSVGPSTLKDLAAKVFLLVFGTSSLVLSFSDCNPCLVGLVYSIILVW